jgi:hypothetical protein
MDRIILCVLLACTACGGAAIESSTECSGGDAAPDVRADVAHADAPADVVHVDAPAVVDAGEDAPDGASEGGGGPLAVCCKSGITGALLPCEAAAPFSCGGLPVVSCTSGGCIPGESCEGPGGVGTVVICGQ